MGTRKILIIIITVIHWVDAGVTGWHPSFCFRVSTQSRNFTGQLTTGLAYQVTPLPLVSPSVTITEAPQVSAFAEQLQLYAVFVAMATLVGFGFAMAMVQVCVSAGKRCHDNMLEALMRAKISFFLVSSLGEFAVWTQRVKVTLVDGNDLGAGNWWKEARLIHTALFKKKNVDQNMT